ncbi:MAG TPA: lactonase family protein [Fimbriimonas sp.]|nr:lactonase family protein [Fimbriimonas sp.]
MLLLPCLFAIAMPAKQVGFYIGTYTSEKGSKGVYHAFLDTETGAITEPVLAAEALAPSYLALHPKGRYLYAVHEFTNGDVSAYEIQPDKRLKKLNTKAWQGAGPCHLSVDPSGRNVLAAAYSGGSFACFPIGADGSLQDATWTFKNAGKPDQKPRGHMIQADARGTTVYACDLGTDELLAFGFDAKRGKLVQRPSAFLTAGSGPRHFAFGRDGTSLYVNGEMAMTLSRFALEGGTPKEVATTSTIPSDVDRKGQSTAEIVCHPSGKWIYVSNRGHDSIAVFKAEGKLLQIQKLDLAIPRGFDIDPSGRWLVAAGQNSKNIASFAINSKTGKLTSTGHRARVDQPVCVLFERS